MRTKKLSLTLLSGFILSGCTVMLPNVRVCAVSGVLSAGADCSYTGDDTTEEMTLEQFLEFLEPQIEPPRGAAMCMSAEDWTKEKIAMEQACDKLGASCKKETRDLISRLSDRADALQAKVMKKRKDNKIEHPIIIVD